MDTTHLQLLTIITEDKLESRLVDDLKQLGVRGYTISNVRGDGSHGERQSPWEGENIKVEIIVDLTLAQAIESWIAKHYFPRYAAILYLTPVQVLRPQKFTGHNQAEVR